MGDGVSYLPCGHRHVPCTVRTDPGAEEEIRLVFGKIGKLARAEAPALFGDYTVTDGAWVPSWRKI
jgi:thymidylate synthase (FAD)